MLQLSTEITQQYKLWSSPTPFNNTRIKKKNTYYGWFVPNVIFHIHIGPQNIIFKYRRYIKNSQMRLKVENASLCKRSDHQ